jgi:hypothetical protein
MSCHVMFMFMWPSARSARTCSLLAPAHRNCACPAARSLPMRARLGCPRSTSAAHVRTAPPRRAHATACQPCCPASCQVTRRQPERLSAFVARNLSTPPCTVARRSRPPLGMSFARGNEGLRQRPARASARPVVENASPRGRSTLGRSDRGRRVNEATGATPSPRGRRFLSEMAGVRRGSSVVRGSSGDSAWGQLSFLAVAD